MVGNAQYIKRAACATILHMALLAMPYGIVVSGYSTLMANLSLPVDTAMSAFPGSASLCKLPVYREVKVWVLSCHTAYNGTQPML